MHEIIDTYTTKSQSEKNKAVSIDYFDIEERNGLFLFGVMTCDAIDRFRDEFENEI